MNFRKVPATLPCSSYLQMTPHDGGESPENKIRTAEGGNENG